MLVLATSVAVAAATVGVDVSSSVSQSEWECLMTPGGQGPIEFMVARIWRSSGSADPNGAATIAAARAAGVKYTDAYMFPCVSCGDPATQVRFDALTRSNETASSRHPPAPPAAWASR